MNDCSHNGGFNYNNDSAELSTQDLKKAFRDAYYHFRQNDIPEGKKYLQRCLYLIEGEAGLCDNEEEEEKERLAILVALFEAIEKSYKKNKVKKNQEMELYLCAFNDLEEYLKNSRPQEETWATRFCKALNAENAYYAFDYFLVSLALLNHVGTLTVKSIASFADVPTWFANLTPENLAHLQHILNIIELAAKIFCLLLALAIVIDLALFLKNLIQEHPKDFQAVANLFAQGNRSYRLVKNTMLLVTFIVSFVFPSLGPILSVAFYLSLLCIFIYKSGRQLLKNSEEQRQIELHLVQTREEIQRLSGINPKDRTPEEREKLSKALLKENTLTRKSFHLESEKKSFKSHRDKMVFLLGLLVLGGIVTVFNPILGTACLTAFTIGMIAYQVKQKKQGNPVRITPALGAHGFFALNDPQDGSATHQPTLFLPPPASS